MNSINAGTTPLFILDGIDLTDEFLNLISKAKATNAKINGTISN